MCYDAAAGNISSSSVVVVYPDCFCDASITFGFDSAVLDIYGVDIFANAESVTGSSIICFD